MEGITPEALEARLVALELDNEKLKKELEGSTKKLEAIVDELQKLPEQLSEGFTPIVKTVLQGLTPEEIKEALNGKATREELEQRYNEVHKRLQMLEQICEVKI